ncbi:site-specific DNA-methyltransferase [Ignavigranum ruoffiae]|uniref:DNA methyltransferase n=1 Tax=Ignavigranum ruoffiae TaxID=89093 RepID=UPI003B003303
MDTKIMKALHSVLNQFEDIYYIEGDLNKSKVIEDIDKYDENLVVALLNDPLIKKHYSKNIGEYTVFETNKLIETFEMDDFWMDSHTKYSKKIGLTTKGKFLDESTDVVLDFPYKDTILKAGMTKEDVEKDDLKPDEPYYNEVIAAEEIDVMLDKKILVNAKQYDVNGVQERDNFDDKDNLIIKGNNLLALHTLRDKYAGKVKMIYIDPPYNTKNDGFIYNDNFNHSSWLTFIYNRLLLAIEFLSVYGVIFIQCDDNEQAYLKVLMDEIFGSENFIANLPTIMNLKGNQDQFGFAGTHEYILVYSKNIRECKLYDLIVDDPDEIEKWDKDEIGYYKQGANLKATGTNGPREKRPNLFFPIYIDEQKNVYLEQHSPSDYELYPITDGVEMSWRWQKSTMICKFQV